MPRFQMQLQINSPSVEKKPTKSDGPVQKPASVWKTIRFLLLLSRQFLEKLSTGAIMLNLAVELVDVVAHSHQEDFNQYLLVAAK